MVEGVWGDFVGGCFDVGDGGAGRRWRGGRQSDAAVGRVAGDAAARWPAILLTQCHEDVCLGRPTRKRWSPPGSDEEGASISARVRWMFEQRLAGRSVASIARELNDRGVPCPSHIDPERNQHRAGDAWTLRTVAVIRRNPRYTGRRVWNRQRTECEGPRAAHRTNPSDAWVISKKIAHPPLTTERDFCCSGGPFCTADEGRLRAGLRIGWAVAVSAVLAPDGLALGESTSRISMPPRPHQHPAPSTRATKKPLRPRGCPSYQARYQARRRLDRLRADQLGTAGTGRRPALATSPRSCVPGAW